MVRQWPVTLQAHIYLLFYKMKTTNSCLVGIISTECESHSGQENPQKPLVLKNKYPQADLKKTQKTNSLGASVLSKRLAEIHFRPLQNAGQLTNKEKGDDGCDIREDQLPCLRGKGSVHSQKDSRNKVVEG